jgi:hypothetical protein
MNISPVNMGTLFTSNIEMASSDTLVQQRVSVSEMSPDAESGGRRITSHGELSRDALPDRGDSNLEISPRDPRALEVSQCQNDDGDVRRFDQEMPQYRLVRREIRRKPVASDRDSGKSQLTDFSEASQSTLVGQRDSALETSSGQERDLEMSLDKGSSGNDADGWDGPEDPENPMNWSKRKRLSHVTMVAVIVFLVSVSYACAFNRANSDLL